jgi:hypothetical protein
MGIDPRPKLGKLEINFKNAGIGGLSNKLCSLNWKMIGK